MALKDNLPSFERGSANLGDQLRELLAVVVEICERLEAGGPPADPPADEATAEAPQAPSEPVAEAPAAEAAKPASKPATRASAK